MLCHLIRVGFVECSLLVTSNARNVEPAAGTLRIKLGAMPRNKACLQLSSVSVGPRTFRIHIHSALPDNLCHLTSDVSQSSRSRWPRGKLDFTLDHVKRVTGEPVADSSCCAGRHVCQHRAGAERSRCLLFETSFGEFVTCRDLSSARRQTIALMRNVPE